MTLIAGRPAAGHAGDLWAITAFFNPVGYRRKYANYRRFRDRLGVPLLAIELGYRDGFELRDDDAEIVVRLRGRDVLWQKERLLNLAVQALPASCRKVAWLDCDILFDDPDWPERTSLALDRFALVQPYGRAFRTPPGWTCGDPLPPEEAIRPAAALMASGMSVAACLDVPASHVGCSLGYAWAAHVDLVKEHRLYDACIVGGGDGAMVRAAYGQSDAVVRLLSMNGARADHYRHWARRFREAVAGSVGSVEGTLFHLWHGETVNRRYRERQQELSAFGFDPADDIAIDHNGAWRWNSRKPAMHASVRAYFSSRREDDAPMPHRVSEEAATTG
jgi:hypothetical protein